MRRLAPGAAALVAGLLLAPSGAATVDPAPGDADRAPAVAPAALPASGGAGGDLVREREYWLDEYGIRDAWAVTRGAGVTIAVIDSGIAAGVPDLAGAVVGGADFSGLGSADGRTPVGTDAAPHGTLVASLAAGRGTGPGDGVIGAAPEADLLSLSIGFGQGATDSDAQVAAAVMWAVDRGADVINMSLTRNTLTWPESWDEAFLYAAEQDVVVVVAAGNRASGTVEVGAPATMPGVLTVAGVDRDGRASWNASSQGITIGVAAPSEDLVGVTPSGEYVTWAGTSGATPIVAGIVALVRAAHPDLDAANVIQRLIATARDAGPAGPDFSYGFGLVDADAAVRAEVPQVTENPMGDLAEWVRINRRAEATPSPVPTETPTPQPIAFPDPIGVLLPEPTDLQLLGPPLVVLLLLAVTGGGLLVGTLTRNRPPRAR